MFHFDVMLVVQKQYGVGNQRKETQCFLIAL